MKEELLHLIWKTKRIGPFFKSTTGEEIEIIKYGFHNSDAGPDFSNAVIRIGQTEWHGHVEFHINASDWEKHKHQHDKAYETVILHVVYNDDKDIVSDIPTLELKDILSLTYISSYENLVNEVSWIPCAKHIDNLNHERLPLFIEQLVSYRLDRKANHVEQLLEQSLNDWEHVLYQMISQYLGLKVNNEAFAILVQKVPYKLLIKVNASLIEKESLLFGQAGLLHGVDQYVQEMKQSYSHIKNKYQLSPMSGVEWKLARLRPANFPTIRISQLSALYNKTPQIFNTIVRDLSLENIYSIFDVTASSYWDTHYTFDKVSTSKKKRIGKSTIHILIINAIIPTVFAYARIIDNFKLKEKVLDLLTEIKPEKNNIINRWSDHGIIADSASQSQGLIELKKEYCDNHRCLDCILGHQIIFGS